jgi:acyl carrier protein
MRDATREGIMTAKDPEDRILSELQQLIVEELHVDVSPSEIDPDSSFFEDGLGIDSIAIVELIALAEERFDVQFADEDLVASSFANIRSFARLIAAKPRRASA